MGLKGYRLWAMGQLDSTCRAPPTPPPPLRDMRSAKPLCSERCSKLHFLKANLSKPVFHVMGTRRLSAMGQGESTWGTAPPLAVAGGDAAM
jgi:hypothetical protein